MQGLTLSQPWATLVAIGAKKIETRSWPTNYRGEVAIHAGLNEEPDQAIIARHPAFLDKLRSAGYTINLSSPFAAWDVPRGVILAVCRIEECVRVEALETRPITAYEYAFGDYRPGRWAWRLADVRPLPKPVKCRGAQRLWNLTPDTLAAVEDQILRPAVHE
jgi:hypothetical protein